VAKAEHQLGDIYSLAGQNADARSAYLSSMAVLSALYGRDHATVASIRKRLLDMRQSEREEAQLAARSFVAGLGSSSSSSSSLRGTRSAAGGATAANSSSATATTNAAINDGSNGIWSDASPMTSPSEYKSSSGVSWHDGGTTGGDLLPPTTLSPSYDTRDEFYPESPAATNNNTTNNSGVHIYDEFKGDTSNTESAGTTVSIAGNGAAGNNSRPSSARSPGGRRAASSSGAKFLSPSWQPAPSTGGADEFAVHYS
jgi:hypothetical protein